MAIRWRASAYNREVNYYHISQVTPRPFTHISQVRQIQWRLPHAISKRDAQRVEGATNVGHTTREIQRRTDLSNAVAAGRDRTEESRTMTTPSTPSNGETRLAYILGVPLAPGPANANGPKWTRSCAAAT